jgi:hypothetical protein
MIAIGRPPLPLDETAFSHDSKETWYVLGISFAHYSSYQRGGEYVENRWQSKYRRLLEIVKSFLGSAHTISGPIQYQRGGSNYLLRMSSTRLFDSLCQRGLSVPRAQRQFPRMQNGYLDHFLRGFLDAQVTVGMNDDGKKNLTIRFNPSFLESLDDRLFYRGVTSTPHFTGNSPLRYSRQEVDRIGEFVYRDRAFLRHQRLYLPSKRAAFRAKP